MRGFSAAALLAVLIVCAFVQPVPAGQAANPPEKVLYSFCSQHNICPDGQFPNASLIDVQGTLYGTAEGGGNFGDCNGWGCGVVFAIDPKTHAERLVYAFCPQFNCPDGDGPTANLIAVNGTLYGTTGNGGANCATCGTVFALNPSTGAEKVLYSFCSKQNCADGQAPYASLINVDGSLFGATAGGGNDNKTCFLTSCGTIFAIDPNTGAERTVYAFCRQPNCTDGATPVAGLIDVKGVLYGTTENGGASCQYCGTVFALNPDTGTETVLHSFAGGADGAGPSAGLIDIKGTLYGTTGSGGAYHAGTVFAIDLKTGEETVLHSFGSGTDGAGPGYGSLIDVKGMLYGTTCCGGAYGYGTVFALDPRTDAETVVHSFDGADGSAPAGGLLSLGGTLYGTTSQGGADGGGTVFSLKP